MSECNCLDGTLYIVHENFWGEKKLKTFYPPFFG